MFLLQSVSGFRIVQFYQPSCPACQKWKATYIELSDRMKEFPVKAFSVSCYRYPILCQQLGISKYPTIRLYSSQDRTMGIDLNPNNVHPFFILENFDIKRTGRDLLENDQGPMNDFESHKPMYMFSAESRNCDHMHNALDQWLRNNVHMIQRDSVAMQHLLEIMAKVLPAHSSIAKLSRELWNNFVYLRNPEYLRSVLDEFSVSTTRSEVDHPHHHEHIWIWKLVFGVATYIDEYNAYAVNDDLKIINELAIDAFCRMIFNMDQSPSKLCADPHQGHLELWVGKVRNNHAKQATFHSSEIEV